MFKIKCFRCKNKISKKYDFCPYCGNQNKNNKEDYGILGRDDIIESNIFESFETSFMDKIFENAMRVAEKMIEKQMSFPQEKQKELFQQNNTNSMRQGNMNIQFFVNGKRVFPQEAQEQNQIKKSIPIKNTILKEKAEKFSKLPKLEPSSKIRRFSGKIIYEMEMPEVKKIEDVLVNQLENSIEIKALGENKVYSKTINFSLPIIGYKLERGNLILELKG
jgi:hypothetical protein